MPGYAGIEGTPNRIGQPRGGISILEGGEGMRTRIAELRWKEVVDVQNGSRFGYVEDLEVDLESGQVRALVLPGRRRLFGLLGRRRTRPSRGETSKKSGRMFFWCARRYPRRPGAEKICLE